MADGDLTFTLTRDEYVWLLMMMGYATGAAEEAHDSQLAHRFLWLANRVNKDNPQWTPYRLPEGFDAAEQDSRKDAR